MWVDCVVHIGDEPVGLCVRRLDAVTRERTAVTLAWMTIEAIGCCSAEAGATWDELMADVLRNHVTFSVSEDRMENLAPEWWHEAVRCALAEFVQQNALAPSINRHIDAIQQIGRAGQPES